MEGGDAASTFSCVLLAELCVGRIIRARNEPSDGLLLEVLTRGFGFWFVNGAAGREDLEGLRRLVPVVEAKSRDFVIGRSPFCAEGLLVFAALARLGDLEGATSPIFAADEAVDAVAPTGRRTGLVGDFGRDFTLEKFAFGRFTGLPSVDDAF